MPRAGTGGLCCAVVLCQPALGLLLVKPLMGLDELDIVQASMFLGGGLLFDSFDSFGPYQVPQAYHHTRTPPQAPLPSYPWTFLIVNGPRNVFQQAVFQHD